MLEVMDWKFHLNYRVFQSERKFTQQTMNIKKSRPISRILSSCEGSPSI